MPLFTPEDLSCVAIGKSHSLKYPYAPFRISGLQDFHRSDMGVTLVGSKASVWADGSGQGHGVSQGVDANRPTVVAGVIGGHEVLRFGPTEQAIHMDFVSWAQPLIMTMYTVIKFVAKTGDYQLFCHDSGASGVSEYLGGNAVAASNDKPMLFSNQENALWSAALVDGTNYLVKWGRSSPAFGTVETHQYYTQVNGGVEVNTSQSLSVTATFTRLGFTVVGTQDLISDLAELLIYGRQLHPIEEAWVRVYTASRYLQPSFMN